MTGKINIDVNLHLTWSKIMALIILIVVAIHKDAALMTFSIPFIVAMIMGKQFIDGFWNSPKGIPPKIDKKNESEAIG